MQRFIFVCCICVFTAFAADFTTYIGDGNPYSVTALTADSAGNTFVTGTRTLASSTDMFLVKVDAAGSVAFNVLLGSGNSIRPNAIAVDASGNIYVAGSTQSTDFPLSNALQVKPGSLQTGFIVKFSPDGRTILYSTYFGGTSGSSGIQALATDSKGNLYVAGYNSPNFSEKLFVAEIAPLGDKSIYFLTIAGTQVQCTGVDCQFAVPFNRPAAIAVDQSGNAYVAGNTNTSDLPTTAGVLATRGAGAFVAKINAGGTGVGYLTYVGNGMSAGSALFSAPTNALSAIAVDSAGNAYLSGTTADPAFPATSGSYQPQLSGRTDAFAAKLKPDGSAMVWSTFLGAGSEAARALAVDSSGNLWMTGITASPAFPNTDGWSQGSDFLIELNSTGSALGYAARYPTETASRSLAIDGSSRLHLAGSSGLISTITPGQAPTMQIFGVANGAGSAIAGRIAPGESIAIFGPHIGPATPVVGVADTAGLLPTNLGGVSVSIEGVAAPLTYVSDGQINAIVPIAGTSNNPFFMPAATTAIIQVSNGTKSSPLFSAILLGALPEIFKNPDGSAIAVNVHRGVNSPTNPAKPGDIVSILATGTGSASIPAGQIATVASAPNAGCFCGLSVTQFASSSSSIDGLAIFGVSVGGAIFIFGDQQLSVQYAGSSPGLPGAITQINFSLPFQFVPTANTIYLQLSVGGQSSATAVLYVSK